MMNGINHIIKQSNSKNIRIGIIFILLVNLVIFPFFSTDFVNSSTILDLHFGFSTDDVLNNLRLMHDSGRHLYLLTSLLIDTPYAIAYGFIYAIIIAALIKRKITTTNQYLIGIPFFISFFDLLENSGIVYFILHYPHIPPVVTQFVSIFNQLKWVFAGITLVLIVILLIKNLMTKLTQNNK